MDDVLVGVDGDEPGAAALEWAASHARVRGARVVVLHAWELPSAVSTMPGAPGAFYVSALYDTKVYADAAGELVTKAVAGLDDVQVRTVTDRGPAAVVVETHARDAGIVVLGRRDHATLAHVVAGSVVGAALHHVDCPVVIVPTGWRPDVETATSRVIVGVAAGQASDGALRWATREAAARGWTLIPVLVRGPALPENGDWSGADLDAAGLARLREHATAAAGGASVRVEPEVLVGSAGEELVRFAQEGDLLVVGSRGRGALAGWLLGSTSSHCAHHARCPVVVVRDSD